MGCIWKGKGTGFGGGGTYKPPFRMPRGNRMGPRIRWRMESMVRFWWRWKRMWWKAPRPICTKARPRTVKPMIWWGAFKFLDCAAGQMGGSGWVRGNREVVLLTRLYCRLRLVPTAAPMKSRPTPNNWLIQCQRTDSNIFNQTTPNGNRRTKTAIMRIPWE